MIGRHIILEGPDMSGKSTAMAAVSDALTAMGVLHVTANNPGSTPLGRHIRQLVKYPDTFDPSIKIDATCSQLLMLVDNIAFVNTILKPTLASGIHVLADRNNFISGAIYGIATGVDVDVLERMFEIVDTPPADKVYIFLLPPDAARSRAERPDQFESRGMAFRSRVCDLYTTLARGGNRDLDMLMLLNHVAPIGAIVPIDATLPPRQIVDQILADILPMVSVPALQ